MNIGIVTAWFDRGAAYVSKAYIEALSPDHQVFVYARNSEINVQGDKNWDTSYVTWGKHLRLGIPMYIVWNDFRSWIEHHKLDIIIFNEQQSWDVVLRTIQLGIKIGAYVDYYTRKTVPFFKLYDFLLCNTRRHYSVFNDHPQCIYIPWGTDCEIYNGNCEPISKNDITLFHSCGMSPSRKGTDILVSAFKKVTGQVKLIIHSQVHLKDQILSAMIQDDARITLIVKTVGPPGLYHLGDVYVYPTRLEGIGLTIPEALASGLPVISVNNAPMNEFVNTGINGILVPVDQYRRRNDDYYWDECICNEAALTTAMQFYVDNRVNLGEYKLAARSYALQNLNWAKNSENLSKWISNIHQIEKSKKLIRKTALYEYSKIPGLMISAFYRNLN